jgi:hypothetical protein
MMLCISVRQKRRKARRPPSNAALDQGFVEKHPPRPVTFLPNSITFPGPGKFPTGKIGCLQRSHAASGRSRNLVPLRWKEVGLRYLLQKTTMQVLISDGSVIRQFHRPVGNALQIASGLFAVGPISHVSRPMSALLVRRLFPPRSRQPRPV